MAGKNSKNSAKPKEIRVVRAAVINCEGKLLMLKRYGYDYVISSTKWEFPGGKCQKGEDLIEALKRELAEETGISIEQLDELIELGSCTLEGGRHDGCLCYNYMAVIKLEDSNVRISSEHMDFGRFHLAEIHGLEITHTMQYYLEYFKSGREVVAKV